MESKPAVKITQTNSVMPNFCFPCSQWPATQLTLNAYPEPEVNNLLTREIGIGVKVLPTAFVIAEQRHGDTARAYSKGISRSLAAEWGTPLSLKAFSCLKGPAVSIFSSGGVHRQTWARELELVFPANRKSVPELRLRKKGSGRRALGTWVRSVNYSSFRCCQFQASDIPAAAQKQNTN